VAKGKETCRQTRSTAQIPDVEKGRNTEPAQLLGGKGVPSTDQRANLDEVGRSFSLAGAFALKRPVDNEGEIVQSRKRRAGGWKSFLTVGAGEERGK